MTQFIKPSLPFKSKLIPVLSIEKIDQAAPLAIALYEGGLDVAEVTFRFPNAHKAIELMKKAAPKLYVGAGTILNENDLNLALSASADFIVTPVITPNLLRILSDCKVPIYPGVSTASEAQAVYEQGYTTVKLFPAQLCGGVAFLKSIESPLPHLTFIPTGGISATIAGDYLSLSNVAAIGGSWMVEKQSLENNDWDNIRKSVSNALRAI